MIPAGDDVIVGIGAAKDALYVTQRQGPLTRLLRVPHAKTIEPAPVALPFAGHVDLGFTDAHQDGAVFELGSWIRSSKFHVFDPVASKVALLPFEPAGKFDAPEGLVAREVRVRSHDGVEVPASIVMRADTRLDGGNPTILYGYGAYGTSEDPGWSPRLLAWLERGGVFVVAHVRGGGVFGDAWHRAGQKTTKPNTWKDGIAVAEWLIAQGYTSARQARGDGRQRRRHFRRPGDDGAAGPLRGGGRLGRQHRSGALGDARQRGRQRAGVRHRQAGGRIPRRCWR